MYFIFLVFRNRLAGGVYLCVGLQRSLGQSGVFKWSHLPSLRYRSHSDHIAADTAEGVSTAGVFDVSAGGVHCGICDSLDFGDHLPRQMVGLFQQAVQHKRPGLSAERTGIWRAGTGPDVRHTSLCDRASRPDQREMALDHFGRHRDCLCL